MADSQGMVQYFYHSPASLLPIRDLLNAQGMGFKREPHIEAGAENLLDSCYQRNIAIFARSIREYLFLVTKCSNRERPEYSKQYVVGYIQKRETGEKEGRVFVRGDVRLVSFEDSLLVLDVFGWNFNRLRLIRTPYVDAEKTKLMLNHFLGKQNILEECIREIGRIDTERITCQSDICGFSESCLRYKIRGK